MESINRYYKPSLGGRYLFLGSLFHTIKGGFDSVTIRRKLKECRDLLSLDELSLLGPYQRFLAQQRLLLTEYLIRCSQLKAKGASLSDLINLKERMNLKMDDLIQNTQQELESHPANKLEVAQLVSSIQQLSIAIDKDLNNQKQEMNNLQKDLSNLKKELNNFKKDTHHLREEQRRQTGSIKALEHDLKLTSERIAVEAEKMNALMRKRLRLIWGLNILLLGVVIIWNVLR